MVRIVIITLLLFPCLLKSQSTDNLLIGKGLLRTQGTFSFGKLLDIKQTGIYLNGNLEYYFNQHISGRGDVYYHLKSADSSLLKVNHQLFSGASYHVSTKSNIDPYIGIQPGIALTQANFGAKDVLLTLLFSGLIGFNYYAENWFHLFFDVRYVYGVHSSKNLNRIDISEIRLSFGLGFNINTIKKSDIKTSL